MEAPNLTPLTPEQLIALEAGHGIVHAQDPATHRAYLLIEEVDPTIDEQYVREKLDEGISAIEAGEVSEWDAEQFKAQLVQRSDAKGQKP